VSGIFLTVSLAEFKLKTEKAAFMNNQEALTEEIEDCPFCRNIYQVVHHKPGDGWNDFGFRYCPFCGVLVDEFGGISHPLNSVPKDSPKQT